ncbi:MAG: NAD(P)/FAD-dependent oxidoreductase [bacterium]|nr:NAD(P)/FAD-dependent oxidoreductase [bacterium]
MAEDGFDVVVIGAGVVGLAIAARLASERRSVLVLERETGIARGVTSRNSEVIHAGIYYPAESLKALSCVEGRERLYAWCESRRVDHRRTEKLIVATAPAEVPTLESLLDKGRTNGVVGLELIDASACRALEPSVRAHAAIRSPVTGIVDAHGFCASLLAEAEAKGAILAVAKNVVGLARGSAGWRVEVRAEGEPSVETISAGSVVDAAGLDADRVAALAGIDLDAHRLRQHPCKGDYFVLGPGKAVSTSRLIYPVPQQAGLGIHLTLDLAGRPRFGPDATYVESRDDFEVEATKAPRFREAVARYLPDLADATLSPDYAGIRPKLAGPGEAFRDFVVEEGSDWGAPGFIGCLGIESPGLTAALALAERVAGLLSA